VSESSPDEVRSALAYVPAHDRETWLRMGMAVKAELGDDGFEIWSSWSQADESYNERDAQSVWRSISPGGKVTARTLFYEASRNGWQPEPARNGSTGIRAELSPTRQQSDAEDADRRRHAQNRAAEIWNNAQPAPADHGYFTRKSVKAHGVRINRGALTIAGTDCDGALVVPVRDSDEQMQSLEFITAEGEKRYLPGGRVAGCYFGLGKPAEVLVIAEGLATAASIHKATTHAVACAFNAGNLPAVAKVLRAKFPNVRIIIAADNDAGEQSNVGVEKAQEAARAVNGLVAVPEIEGRKCDFNDVAVVVGADAVRAAIEAAKAPPTEADVEGGGHGEIPEEDGESSRVARRIAELAHLSRVDYDRIRKGESKTLGIQLRTLDTEVLTLRKEMADDPTLTFEDPEPWPAEVDGADLLNGICSEVERYLVLPPHASTAISLWALHTWCLDAFFITPFLYPRSPEKRCGKTTLMLVVHELVRRPLLATNASPAALFRCIEEYRPTLLLDEADTWLRENEELRGILNGGHSRKTARVIRTVGEEHEVRAFSTYCPKAIAGIGRLADTLEDRSIVVPMKRKRVEDRTAPLREDRLDLLEIRRRCWRWAGDHLEALRRADPPTPPALNDRAADNWRALLAIADEAGGVWPQQARSAAVALAGQTDDEAIGSQLLADVRDYFSQERDSVAILSRNLAFHLAQIEGRPWAEWGKGDKPISQNQVARLLKRFDIHTRDVRDGQRVAKGYLREHFMDAFARYLPVAPQSATALQPQQLGSQPHSLDRYSDLDSKRYSATDGPECSVVADGQNSHVADQNGKKPYENRDCSGVADHGAPEGIAQGATDEPEVF
jgi:putative DNA primase/helicase